MARVCVFVEFYGNLVDFCIEAGSSGVTMRRSSAITMTFRYFSSCF